MTTPSSIESSSTRSAYGTLMPLIREQLWPPDGKPPQGWDERREGSILKRLLLHRSVSQLEVAILGLARLRDQHFVNWLKPGEKVTCRALYNSRSGVSDMFGVATAAYWRAAKRPKPHKDASLLGDILDRLARRPQEYNTYIQSSAWKQRRTQILARAQLRCERCNNFGNGLDVHHLNYDRFGQERDSDLIVLCWPCHKKADRERRGEA